MPRRDYTLVKQTKVPKIRDNSFRVPIGNHDTNWLWFYDVAALLRSQSHFKKKDGSWSGGGEFHQASYKASHRVKPYIMVKNNSLAWGTAGGVSNLSTALPAVGTPSSSAPNVGSIVNSFGTIDQIREAYKVDFAEAWSRTRPGAPEASLMQFIVELRDFPAVPGRQFLASIMGKAQAKRMKKYRNSFLRSWLSGPPEQIPWKLQTQLGIFKALGSEYLNHVFGWVPFISDLEKLYVLSQTIDNRLIQIKRDNNRGIRRKAKIRNDQEMATLTATNPNGAHYGVQNAPPNWGLNGKSVWTTTTKLSTKVWYSARYRYYIPDMNAGTWIPKARAVLSGANITPSLVWELTPWSWLVDWFGNIGTVLSNFSENAVENLTADYSFLMVNLKATTISSSFGGWKGVHSEPGSTFLTNIPDVDHDYCSVYEREIKARVYGSPYGLGVKFSSLNNRQLGVLAALGITQSSF